MKVLFISKDLIAGNLALLLKKEGHEVKLYIEDQERRENLNNIVAKTGGWRKELDWVGKDGLVVFDDVGHGNTQDQLRRDGYMVVGGSELAEKLELDREFGQKIFSEYGLKTVILKNFESIDDAIFYVQSNPATWVIKKNSGASKFMSYVGELEDGRDVIDLLKNYSGNKITDNLKISLQKRIYGVEIGVGRYFNGNNWVGPIEFNVEYTKFFPGDIGPITSEMGTLAWYSDNEDNKLYRETIEKLEPYLRKINFRGDFELNCIVNETGAYILEATPRFGSPMIHLQSEIHESPWGEFLYAIAKGESYNLKWKKGYGIVVAITVPPFPYFKESEEGHAYGINVHFSNIDDSDTEHIHFEEVAKRTEDSEQLYISDKRGYILYVTGIDTEIPKAQKKVYEIIKKIHIPKMIYRNDIGQSFLNESEKKLKAWGYL